MNETLVELPDPSAVKARVLAAIDRREKRLDFIGNACRAFVVVCACMLGVGFGLHDETAYVGDLDMELIAGPLTLQPFTEIYDV
ncbi:hypothetical protein FACS1894186_3130 [Alphaproteobacteria bacterium]|nr:hypothetical protein FACS1894186_3130 [Alphaproteobacteria bacterium]